MIVAQGGFSPTVEQGEFGANFFILANFLLKLLIVDVAIYYGRLPNSYAGSFWNLFCTA
jgi:hypothetical protein